MLDASGRIGVCKTNSPLPSKDLLLCDCVVSVLMILDFKPVESDWCVQDKDVSTYLRKLSLLDIVLLSEVSVPMNH